MERYIKIRVLNDSNLLCTGNHFFIILLFNITNKKYMYGANINRVCNVFSEYLRPRITRFYVEIQPIFVTMTKSIIIIY